MENAAQDATVIDPPRARLVSRQHWLDQRPSVVVQPEMIARHSRHPWRFLEHHESHKQHQFNVLIRFSA
jgi:hypothetical protein